MNTDAQHNDINNSGLSRDETGPETKAAGFCRICGKALREEELHLVNGVVYCADHAPAEAPPTEEPPSPWTTPAPPVTTDVSPGLAFLLGLIPGVGAIYNSQYAKGLVHVVITGLLISIVDTGAAGLEPLFGLLIAGWWFYMPFEAYHTAKKRRLGEKVDEFSGLVHLKGPESSLLAPAILIAGGILFLLLNFGLINFYEIVRFWPVVLIVIGVYMLYARYSGRSESEVNHER